MNRKRCPECDKYVNDQHHRSMHPETNATPEALIETAIANVFRGVDRSWPLNRKRPLYEAKAEAYIRLTYEGRLNLDSGLGKEIYNGLMAEYMWRVD